MIRYVFLFVVAISATFNTNAQRHTFGIGIGSSNDYFLDYETGVGSGVRFSYDQNWKSWDRNRIELGAILGITSTEANYTPVLNWRATYRWSSVVPAFRATFHHMLSQQIDLYGGVHVGLRFLSYTERISGPYPVGYASPEFRNVYAFSGAFIGMDYVTPAKIRIFGELGYDLMWFTLGVKYSLD